MLADFGNHTRPSIFASGTDWAQGDWNHDGVVNFNDYSLMQDNYDQNITSPPDSPTTLTYILSINDDGSGNYCAGDYAVYAADGSDNGGLAGFEVSVDGYATINNVAPEAKDSSGSYRPVGFNQSRSTTPPEGSQDSGDVLNGETNILLVYGIGQTAGNLAGDLSSAGGAINAKKNTQPVYGAPVELITGTFTSGVPSLTDQAAGDYAHVFQNNTGANTEPATLVFNTQYISSVTATGETFPAVQGQATGDEVLATFTDSVSGTTTGNYSASIDWGDGSTPTAGVITTDGNGNFTVSGNHTYSQAGTSYPDVTITEGNATADAYGEADVTGFAISPQTINATLPAGHFSGTVATFTDNGIDASDVNSDYSATINWGDGNTSPQDGSAVVVAYDSSNDDFTITGNHTYSSAGTPTVTITVTGPDSRTGNVSTAADVTSLTVTGETFSAAQGGNFSGNVATFTDVNANTDPTIYTASIDWLGDGSDVTTGTVAYNSVTGNFTVSGNNTFTSAGTFNPVVTITDIATGNSTATGTATGNVSGIIATAADPVAATQDAAIGNVTLATFINTTKPTGDSYTASIDWLGDGSDVTSGTVTTDGQGNYTVSGNITTTTYTSAGTFNPVVTIADTVNQTSATADAEVDVAGITVTADPINVLLGGNFTGTVATFADTAPDASTLPGNYSATINWGDGNTTGNIAWDGTNDDFTVTDAGNHTYSTAGTPTVIVTITDLSDGRSAVSSGTVANVTSLTVTGQTFDAAQGANYNGPVLTFTDSNSGTAASDYSASIDWLGDGTDITTGNISGNGTFTVAGTNTFACAGTFNPVVTITDTGAGNSTASGQSTAIVRGIVANAANPAAATQDQAANNVPLATFINGLDLTGTGNYSATIDWLGNGSEKAAGSVSYSSATDTFTVTGNILGSTFTSAKIFNPVVTITQTTSTGNISATVSGEVDVAGITASPNMINAVQGGNFSGIVGYFSDTAADATTNPGNYTATIYWGDGGSSTGNITYNSAAGQFVISGNHTYTSGTPNVSFTITGPDGRTTSTSDPIADDANLQGAAVTGLYDTGIGNDSSPLANGNGDTHYSLNFYPQAIDTSTNPTYPPPPSLSQYTTHETAYSVDDNQYPLGNSSAWMDDSAMSRWIGPAAAGNETWIPGDDPGYYDYRTTFTLTSNVDPSTFSLSGEWATDNTGLDILVNGTSSGSYNSAQFSGFTPFTLTRGFVTGVNTLDFIVENGLKSGEWAYQYNNGVEFADGGPAGLRVQFTPQIRSLNFTGGATIDRDNGQAYVGPQWFDGNDNGVIDPDTTPATQALLDGTIDNNTNANDHEDEYPLAYPTGTQQISVTLTLGIANGLTPGMKIEGTAATKNDGDITFGAEPVQLMAGSNGNMYESVTLTANVNFTKLDSENVTFTWQYSSDGTHFTPFGNGNNDGTTTNHLFVYAGASAATTQPSTQPTTGPTTQPSAPTFLESVLWFGCQGGAGLAPGKDDQAIIKGVWTGLSAKHVYRVDGAELIDSQAADAATDAAGLLGQAQGEGQGTAWSQLYALALQSQGEQAPGPININNIFISISLAKFKDVIAEKVDSLPANYAGQITIHSFKNANVNVIAHGLAGNIVVPIIRAATGVDITNKGDQQKLNNLADTRLANETITTTPMEGYQTDKAAYYLGEYPMIIHGAVHISLGVTGFDLEITLTGKGDIDGWISSTVEK